MGGLIELVIGVPILLGVIAVSLFIIYRVVRHPKKADARSAPSGPWRVTTKIGCLAGYLSAVLLLLFIEPWKRMGEGGLPILVCLLVLLGLGLVAGLIMLVVSFGQALFRRSQREEDDPE